MGVDKKSVYFLLILPPPLNRASASVKNDGLSFTGVVMGVTEGVSSESVDNSAATFLLPPRLLGWALPLSEAVLPLAVLLPVLVPVVALPSALLLAVFLLSFVLSVALRFSLLLVVSSVLVLLPADLFLAPPLLVSAGAFLFDTALSFSAELLRVLAPLVVSVFVLPFLLAPPLVLAAVVVAVLSLLNGGCGSSRVFAGNYKNIKISNLS